MAIMRTATLVEGIYWNSAAVPFQKSSPNKAFRGPPSPVKVSAIYDNNAVSVTVNGGDSTATVKIVDCNITTPSWQVE